MPRVYFRPTCPLYAQHRCSGDFSQCKQTKYNQSLPGLPEKIISDQLMADITEMERAVARQPGMYGRIWYGQGLAFDEAYQILQERLAVSMHPTLCMRGMCRCITSTDFICV